MTIDRLQESDIPAALRLSTQAGWNQLEADWRRMLALWPDACLAGRLDGQVIATATLAIYEALAGTEPCRSASTESYRSARTEPRRSAWVGMILVDEAHRGQGHGGKILDAIIELGASAGVRTLGLDATDLGRPVYLKRGFRDVGGIDRWILESSRVKGAPLTEESGSSLKLVPGVNHTLTPLDLRDIIALDSSMTGLDRRQLLTALSKEAGVECRFLRESGRVIAFAFSRPGRTATHLGPVIGETEAAACKVLDEIVRHAGQIGVQSILIDVPRGRLSRWLAECGFVCSRKLTRMQLGSDVAQLTHQRVFAASGFELG